MIKVFMLVCSGIGFSASKQASAKTAAKVTLTSSKAYLSLKLSINKNEKVSAKVKILAVKGKTKGSLFLGEYEFTVYKKKK